MDSRLVVVSWPETHSRIFRTAEFRIETASRVLGESEIASLFAPHSSEHPGRANACYSITGNGRHDAVLLPPTTKPGGHHLPSR
jgi:hypothetical protein